jgi:hypothetical protein
VDGTEDRLSRQRVLSKMPWPVEPVQARLPTRC